MKKSSCYKKFVFLMIILTLTIGCGRIELFESNQPTPPPADPVEGWAVLAEKDDYDDPDMPDMLVDYIDIIRMQQTLENSGWNPDHIHDVREFNRKTFQAELDWLEMNADKNDIVILYVSAHGNYLSDVMFWHSFFANEWAQILSQRRLLVIDVCKAASFTNVVISDSSPHLTIAAVNENELGWRGLEEEGLPIIGSVFTYYFTAALDDPAADTNGDGRISVQEAALMAEKKQRSYFHDVIFVVPEFLEMYHTLGVFPENDPTYPRMIMDDAIGRPLFLALDAYP